MTMERADLSVSLSLEQMVPVSAAPAAQGQSSLGNAEGKARRRPPPVEESSAEPSEEDDGLPQHRIDSLA